MHSPAVAAQLGPNPGFQPNAVAPSIGISPHAWGQAWITLGGDGAITALAAICARHATGKVKSPGGLLRKMVELHQKGTLRLDRTLFGLAEKVGNGRHTPAKQQDNR